MLIGLGQGGPPPRPSMAELVAIKGTAEPLGGHQRHGHAVSLPIKGLDLP